MIQIFSAGGRTDGRTDGRTGSPEVVQKVLADLKLIDLGVLDVKKKKSPIIANDNHAKDRTSSRHSACESVDVAPELS